MSLTLVVFQEMMKDQGGDDEVSLDKIMKMGENEDNHYDWFFEYILPAVAGKS